LGCSITENIARECKSLQGGIDKLYIFPYVKYSRSQITINDQIVTSFPSTTIYDWYGININFNENTEVIGGDIAWNQNLTFDILKTGSDKEIYKLPKQYYRAIFIDRIGNIRILGLFNGLDAQITEESGGDKSSLNGYKITFTGKEVQQALYLNDLSDFDIHTENDYLFQDGVSFEFEDGTNYIFN